MTFVTEMFCNTPSVANWVEADEKDWRRVAVFVRVRRAQLGTQKDVAAKSDLGPIPLINLENVNQLRYRGLTIAAVEKALGWQIGTIQRLLEDPNALPSFETAE